MIFVTTGTQLPFDRLFDMIDILLKENIIKQEICCQGISNKIYENFKIIPQLDSNQFQKALDSSELIISHAGIGTFLQSKIANKRIIMIPRDERLHEHRNSHQRDIIILLKEKNIEVCENISELRSCLLNKKLSEKKIKIPNIDFLKNLKSIIMSELNI